MTAKNAMAGDVSQFPPRLSRYFFAYPAIPHHPGISPTPPPLPLVPRVPLGTHMLRRLRRQSSGGSKRQQRIWERESGTKNDIRFPRFFFSPGSQTCRPCARSQSPEPASKRQRRSRTDKGVARRSRGTRDATRPMRFTNGAPASPPTVRNRTAIRVVSGTEPVLR
jgi:hypothetical protein